MHGPDPNNPSPMAGFPQVGFLKNFISRDNISVGDYTYYDDPEGVERFINTIASFKIGYPINEQHFYSWLGGVIPEYRGNGIAQQLLAEQERRAAERGYTTLSVKSMNRFPDMLCLLIKNGYQITDVSHHGDEYRERIHFSKSLHSTVQ